MAISDKLNYLIETKSQLKDMINYGLDDDNKITSSTTFRNYVSSIFEAFLEALRTPDTLFTNLPKITGTGSNITLNDTANAPMRIMLNATDITQAGTPTPSSPQDIHTISGSNKVVVCGKNLFKISGYTKTGWIITIDNPLKGMTAGKYSISAVNNYITSGKGIAIYNANTVNTEVYDRIGTLITNYDFGNTTLKSENRNLTQEQLNCDYMIISPTNKDCTEEVLNNMKIMIEKGSNATGYEPYISQEADIDLHSYNLIDISQFQNGTIDGSTGADASASGNARGENYIPVKPNTKYTISANITLSALRLSEYRSDKTHIQRDVGGNVSSYTITTTANTYFLRWSLNYNNSINPNEPMLKGIELMLNEGDTRLEYQEYYDYGFMGSIGNYEDKFIRTSGKNLFDSANANVLNLYINTSGEILTASNGKSIYIECEPSTTYTISRTAGARFRITDTSVVPANGVTGSQFVGIDTASKLVITTSATAKYLVVNYYPGNSDTLSEQTIRDSIMIQKGNIENPQYEPYSSNGWYIKKNIGKYVANNDLTGNGTSDTTVSLITPALNINASLGGTALANISKNNLLSGYSSTGVNTLNGTTGTKCIRVVLSKDYCSDYATANTFLKDNNFTICYVLATPTYTKITGTLANQLENVYQLLKSYKGVTNISQVNNDLPFELDVQAIEDME